MYDFKCDKKFNSKLNISDTFLRYSNILNSNKKNIIIVTEHYNDSTFRYRGYNIIQTMENNEKYNITHFLVTELNFLYDLLDNIDLVIIHRELWSFNLENFINIIKKLNIPILYDVDDLIYSPKYVPNYINSVGDLNNEYITKIFSISARYELIAKKCDGFIVTTKNLADNVKKDFNKPVWIFHNYMNLEQEEVSNEVINLKEKSFSNDKFIMGYFSGSNSHKRDLEIVESALIRLFNSYDDIYLKIVGYMQLPSQLKKFKREGRIIFADYMPFEQLQYEIGQVDLNIVPLQKHKFNECKSELKYFEASIVNTLTCATDNSVFKEVIDDGIDGFLSDEISWFEKIEYIYLNYDKLDKITENARNKCLKKYSSKKQEGDLEKMYDDIFREFGID